MAENSIGHISRRGFGGVLRPHGRDNRMQFWLFSALVFGPLIALQIAAQMALTFPSFDSLGATGPGTMPAGAKIFEEQIQGMVTSAYATIGVYLVGALLLLSAAARRLHDRGRSGWWALILPLGLFATALGQAERMAGAAKRMPAMLAEMERQAGPDPAAMVDWMVKANASPDGPNWLAIIGGLLLLGLLIELARAGMTGANRFGPTPQ